MKEKQALTRQVAARYRKAGKKDRGKILDEFVKTTRYTRKYASWILRMWGRKRYVWIDGELIELIVGQPRKRKRRKRERIYNEAVFKALKKVWYLFDCLCGKRLAPVLRSMLPILYKFGEIDFTDEVRSKLERISPATIDRLLKNEKKKLRIKGRSYTKPGTLLKHQIPIRTFDGWDEKKPGYVEVDLVGHDGGNSSGDFAFTLNVTDVNTGWTEPMAIKNKAQKWTFEALMQVQQRIPFKILGIDSDNGGEFINDHLFRYCKDHHITFTRSRPYRKNDNCFVEQKNNSVVRRYVGYCRYDTEEQLKLLNEIYERVRLLINYFYPSQKLISKHRSGSKVIKRHDVATTPHQRLLASGQVSQIMRQKLNLRFNELNPAELLRQMLRLQQKLAKMTINMNQIPQEAAG
jgi:hypothetical protein